jgi:hypothetical protein
MSRVAAVIVGGAPIQTNIRVTSTAVRCGTYNTHFRLPDSRVYDLLRGARRVQAADPDPDTSVEGERLPSRY